jgi:U4/U6.U5 tri-snRNP-associated protein 1
MGVQARFRQINEHHCSHDRSSRVRNRRELNASLKGTTLGDADGDVDDTLKWVKKSKKKEKELAKKRQEELERMDKAFQGEEYTESTLWISRLIVCSVFIFDSV